MTDDTKHLLSNATNAQRLQESIEELNNGGGVTVDPATFDTVDTSKEAVERLARVLDGKDGFAFTGINGNLASAALRALLAERDQLRREVEEARDKALEEASQIADEIRALKARP